MGLTPEQAAIVHAGDIDLAVSAGAGTGKTHVLVERYVTLLERCSIPEVVAITFTEAAAAEMRQRVRREVLTRDGLESHRRDVDDAIIGTIHSLCLRLLREHPVEAALDPAVRVLGEDEAELLRLEASVAAVDAAAESDGPPTAALQALGVFQSGVILPQMVASRDDVRASFAPLFEEGVDLAVALRERVDRECAEAIEPLRYSVPAELDRLLSHAIDLDDRLAVTVQGARAVVVDAEDVSLEEWAALLAQARAGMELLGGRQASWDVSPQEARDMLRAIRDGIAEAFAKAQPWNEHDDAAVEVLPGLRALFEDACDRYEALKTEARGLDFLDLEVSAVRLLEGHPEVAEAYRRTWRHLMVDEAQDVSGLQARLIRAFTSESAGSDVARPRLFLVGDEKQSIYRFRGADVRQFRDLQHSVTSVDGQLLPLSASFRTHSTLVEQANDLFEVAFDGSEVHMERMTGRPGDPPRGPHLTVMPVEGKDATRKRLAEADVVAAEIEALLGSVRQVWDKRLGAYRAVEVRDIAILLRRYQNVHLFEQSLETRGIPSATPSGTGFFRRSEVLDLTNLLRWIVEPDDQLALAAVLRSPLFILRDDTLFLLRGGPTAPTRYMQYALDDPPPALDPEEQERCRFAGRVLEALRHSARTVGAADLVEEALVATGYEASWAALSGGEQALANIRKFARICRELAGYTIAEVVAYLERRRDELTTREGPAVLDRPEAVQLMTVHGAKGLEFPVVFVPEAHLRPTISWDAVRWRAGEGVSLTFDQREGDESRPRPAFYSLLTNREIADEDEEHLRLFYVAATRAGDYLYLSGEQKNEQRAWMIAVQRAVDEGKLRGVDIRDTVDAESRVAQRLTAPRTVQVPAAEAETPFTPELLSRPRVIPIRTSTPATALKVAEVHRWARGDGLGLVRGRIIHRVIEASATYSGDAFDEVIEAIALEETRDLQASVRAGLVAEAREMLDRFRASPTGVAVAAAGADARFEAPFAWYWDGVPVHGQIDLLYRDATTGEWWVVDFKTDRVDPGREARAAEPYLVQIGLYAGAVEAATGTRPRSALLFLRTGVLHEPSPSDLDAALATAHRRVDEGLGIVTGDEYLEGYADEYEVAGG